MEATTPNAIVSMSSDAIFFQLEMFEALPQQQCVSDCRLMEQRSTVFCPIAILQGELGRFI